MNGPIRMSVSIVSHGHDDLIAPLLDDLAGFASSISLELILTENIPGRLESIARSSGVPYRLIKNSEPRGFGANHNAAFALSTGEFFAVLNPDLRMTTGNPLAILAEQVRLHPGVAGPKVLAPGGGIEDSARRNPSVLRLASRVLLGRRQADYDANLPVQPVDWLAGMCLVFDRASFAAIDGFDERYHLYCEDVDVCLRLHLAGKSVSWVQGASVVHDARRQTTVSSLHFRWHLASLWRLMTSSAYWRYIAQGSGSD